MRRKHQPGSWNKAWNQASRRQRQQARACPLPGFGSRLALDKQTRVHDANLLCRQFDGSRHHPVAHARLVTRRRFRDFDRRDDPLFKMTFRSRLEVPGNLPLAALP